MALCEAVLQEGAGWDSDLLRQHWPTTGTAESRWNWGVWRTRILLSCYVTIPEGQRLDDVRFSSRTAHVDAGSFCANPVHNGTETREGGKFVVAGGAFLYYMLRVEAGTLCLSR